MWRIDNKCWRMALSVKNAWGVVSFPNTLELPPCQRLILKIQTTAFHPTISIRHPQIGTTNLQIQPSNAKPRRFPLPSGFFNQRNTLRIPQTPTGFRTLSGLTCHPAEVRLLFFYLLYVLCAFTRINSILLCVLCAFARINPYFFCVLCVFACLFTIFEA